MSSTSRDNDLETSLDGSESTKSPRSGKKRINVVQITPLNLAKANGSDSKKNNPSTSPRSARSSNISNSPRKKDSDRKLRVSIGPGSNEEIVNGLNNGNLAAIPANNAGGSPANGTQITNCTAVPAAVSKADAASRRRSSSTPQKVQAQAKTPLSSSPVKPNMIPPINTASMTSPIAIPEVSSARRREIVSLKLSAIKKTDDDGLESSATPPSSRKHFTALALRNQDLDEVDLFDFFLQKEREFADNKDFVSPFRYIKSIRSISQPPTPSNHSISSSTTPPDLELKEEANHLEMDASQHVGATTIRFAPETFNTAQVGPDKPQETKRDHFPNFSDWATHMASMLRKKKEDLNPSLENPTQRL